MVERKYGIYRFLSHPRIYEASQRLMNADALRTTFVRDYVRANPGDRILDIGCGPAHLLKHLPDVDYVGFDPNPAYIASARRKYGTRGEFHDGLFGMDKASTLAPVDIAIVSAVLHHLDDEQAYDLFSCLRRVVKPGGRVVTVDNVFVPGQNIIARFLIGLDRGRHVRTPDTYKALALRSFNTVIGTVMPRAFPPYTYFFMDIR